jgi:hypothetical protein
MQEDRVNPQPEDQNVEKNENGNLNSERFESDTQKVVRQHLEDENHVITEEDIANVRVGMNPPKFDTPTEEFVSEAEEKIGTDESGADDTKIDKNLEDERITPWDTIDPTK